MGFNSGFKGLTTRIFNNARTFVRDWTDPAPFQSNSIFILYFHLDLRFPKSRFTKRFLHWSSACNPQAFLPVSFQIHVSRPSESRAFSKLSLSLCFCLLWRFCPYSGHGLSNFLEGSKQVSFYEVGLSALRPTSSNAGGPTGCFFVWFPVANPPSMRGPAYRQYSLAEHRNTNN